jgi:hypothetical protein
MKSIKVVSFIGCFALVMSMVLFAVGMNFFGNLPVSIACFILTIVLLFVSFVLIGRMHCKACGNKLKISPFPSYNQRPNFLLWTGVEARCGHCLKKV